MFLKRTFAMVAGLATVALTAGSWVLSANASESWSTSAPLRAITGAAPYSPDAKVIGGPLPESTVKQLMDKAASNGGDVEGHAVLAPSRSDGLSTRLADLICSGGGYVTNIAC